MMRNLAKNLSVVLAVALLFGCSSEKSPQSKALKVAQAEPETPEGYVEQAKFTDLEGNTVSISDFRGKVVLIDFWETWCKPCLASFPTLQKLQDEYPDNFVVLAVTPGFTDSKADAESFAQNHAYTFRYLMDSNNLHKKLNVYGIPYKVYVDAQGNFIKKSMGTAGPEEDYKKIKQLIKKHSNL